MKKLILISCVALGLLGYTPPDETSVSNNEHPCPEDCFVLVQEHKGYWVLTGTSLFFDWTGYDYMYYAYHDINSAWNAHLSSNSIDNLGSYHALIYTNYKYFGNNNRTDGYTQISPEDSVYVINQW
jgi:hypothetical protein